MITTFLFDLGGVLFTNGTKKFIKELSISHNIPEDKLRKVIDGEIGSLYRESKIMRDEFWKKVIEILQLPETANTLEQEWIEGYQIISGTKEIIIELSKKYKVFYLSDNVKERVDSLNKKFNFIRLFKGGIFSHEAGVRKPNQKIYELALHKSNSKPEETIFIDDKPHFFEPAKRLGIETILFTTPEELKKNLIEKKLI